MFQGVMMPSASRAKQLRLGCLAVEAQGTVMLRVDNHSNSDIVSHHRRHESFVTRWINTCACNGNFSEIEKLVEQDKDRPIDNLSVLARIQRIQHTTLVWMFAKAVSDYSEVLLKHQERCRAIMQQQLMISKLSMSGNRVLGEYLNEKGRKQQ
jgi:hypothetical protein